MRKHLGPDATRGLYWVNGHLMNVNRVTAIRQIAKGRYEIETTHLGTWRVEGGRHRGGGPREWFLDQGEDDPKPYIRCTGLADAVRCIETM
jgi:hypothetical protein